MKEQTSVDIEEKRIFQGAVRASAKGPGQVLIPLRDIQGGQGEGAWGVGGGAGHRPVCRAV